MPEKAPNPIKLRREPSTGTNTGFPTYSFKDYEFSTDVKIPQPWPTRANFNERMHEEFDSKPQNAEKRRLVQGRNQSGDTCNSISAFCCCTISSNAYSAVQNYIDQVQGGSKVRMLNDYWATGGAFFGHYFACNLSFLVIGIPCLWYLEQRQSNRVADFLQVEHTPIYRSCCSGPTHRDLLFWYLYELEVKRPRMGAKVKTGVKSLRSGPKFLSKFSALEGDQNLEVKLDLQRAVKKAKKQGFILEGKLEHKGAADAPYANPMARVDTEDIESIRAHKDIVGLKPSHCREFKENWDKMSAHLQQEHAEKLDDVSAEDVAYQMRKFLDQEFTKGQWSVYEERIAGGDEDDGTYYVFVRNADPESPGKKAKRVEMMRQQMKIENDDEANDCADLAVTMYEVVAGTGRGVANRVMGTNRRQSVK